MADPADYTQLPNGTWIKDADNTGPYVRTAADTFVLASTGSGGGGGGGGGGGDASAANQLTEIAYLTSISSTQGNGGDSPAASDIATASQIAIAKRTNVLLSSLQAQGTLTNRSGTVTTGGTAQQLMPSNTSRKGFSVQNLSTGDLWFNSLGTAAASQPSMKLVSGAYFETPAGYGATGGISIFGATTGQAFSAREW